MDGVFKASTEIPNFINEKCARKSYAENFKNIKVYYHDDMDGRASAGIVYKHHRGVGGYIPMASGGKIALETITKDDLVYILDFSLDDTGEMAYLLDRAYDVIWIDHHKTALEKFGQAAVGVKGIRRVGDSGCKLTWQYFYPDTPLPMVLRYLNDYDIRDPKEYVYRNTLSFQKGISLQDTRPQSGNWKDWLSPYFTGLKETKQGKIVLEHLKIYHKDILDQLGYVTDFEGNCALVCNYPRGGSVLFETERGKYDMFIFYAFDGKDFVVSMRADSPDVDVSVIATKYGGGGHAGAAGFRCKTLPFTPLGERVD